MQLQPAKHKLVCTLIYELRNQGPRRCKFFLLEANENHSLLKNKRIPTVYTENDITVLQDSLAPPPPLIQFKSITHITERDSVGKRQPILS
jgi:hypothetical protein